MHHSRDIPQVPDQIFDELCKEPVCVPFAAVSHRLGWPGVSDREVIYELTT